MVDLQEMMDRKMADKEVTSIAKLLMALSDILGEDESKEMKIQLNEYMDNLIFNSTKLKEALESLNG